MNSYRKASVRTCVLLKAKHITHHFGQMKLFNTIAAAPVIGASITSPVQAQSQLDIRTINSTWNSNRVAAQQNWDGRFVIAKGKVNGIYDSYFDLEQSGGSIQIRYDSSKSFLTSQVAKLKKGSNVSVIGEVSLESGWFGGKAFSISAREINIHRSAASSQQTPSRKTRTTTSLINSHMSCNEKVDEVFYKRYPELKGKKLSNMNSSIAREWIEIQDSIC